MWKRYSDFRRLHQNLLQLHKNVCSQSELFPPFAKAKVFGKKDQPVSAFSTVEKYFNDSFILGDELCMLFSSDLNMSLVACL